MLYSSNAAFHHIAPCQTTLTSMGRAKRQKTHEKGYELQPKKKKGLLLNPI